MLKRFIAMIAAGVGLQVAAKAQEYFTIGSYDIIAPTGWREVKKKEDLLVLRSAVGDQRATITLMRFRAEVSFEDFTKLCDKRMEAERSALTDGFIHPDAPFERHGVFGMFFSGGDRKSGRVFSGYLSLATRELVTVYVESISVAPEDHLQSFKAFVNGLKKK